MLERREFMQRAAIGAALLGMPLARAEQFLGQEFPPMPSKSLLLSSADADRYWSELRRQWLLAADRINLNCGSVGCTPLPVLRAMIEHILSAESYREGPYPWFGYEENTRLRELRDAMSAFIGCKRDELALTRNATEGNSVVANGLDLKVGDEVLMSDQEHPGGRCVYEQKAARFGIKLNYFKLPRPPASKEEILDVVERAFTPRTRVLFFSHITTVTGLILPAKELCALARTKGALSHIDGAHCVGQLRLDMHDIGCDFYVSSPHKWLMAPKGTGILYVREEDLQKLWVNTVSGEWKNYEQKAYRFSNFGTSNLSVMVGLKAALDFFQTIGPELIYARQHQLATRVRDAVLRYPQKLKFGNASKDEFFGALVSFDPVGAPDGLKFIVRECAARNIRIAGGPEHIRISTNIFTQPTELNAFFDAMDAGLRM
jgi:selenocysteine lyase/cysteine desulfurase